MGDIQMGRLYRRTRGMDSILFPQWVYTISTHNKNVHDHPDKKILFILSLYENSSEWTRDVIIQYRLETEYDLVEDE